MGIKWIKLQNIVYKLTGVEANISLTSLLHEGLEASVIMEKGVTDILLNMSFNKEEGQVLRNISHEVAHIITRSPEHDKEFEKTWTNTYEQMKEYYYGNRRVR